jgi:hypothetical protein
MGEENTEHQCKQENLPEDAVKFNCCDHKLETQPVRIAIINPVLNTVTLEQNT